MRDKMGFSPDTVDIDIKTILEEPQQITFAEGHKWVEIKVHGNNKCPNCSKALIPFVANAGMLASYIYGFCPRCDKAFQLMQTDAATSPDTRSAQAVKDKAGQDARPAGDA